MRNEKGFTLIEIVMVIILLGFLAAAALPRFIDMSTEAKEAGTKGAIGGVRGTIAVFYANTALKGNARYPATIAEIEGSMSDGKLPDNPYSTEADKNDGEVTTDGLGVKSGTADWRYNATTGQFWSAVNGGTGIGANGF